MPPMILLILRISLVAAVYFLTARLGLLMDAVGGVATTVWPPTGIALAALLLLGYRLWPGIALAAFLVNLSVGVPFFGALGMAAGNTLEALIGTYLLNRFAGFRPSLERLRDVVALVIFGSLISTVISATIGVTSGWLTGVISPANYGTAWRSWWVGDMLGDLVLAPVLLIWGTNPRVERDPGQAVEALALLGSVIILSLVIFGGGFGLALTDFPQPYLLFPFLIWAAVRFSPRGVVAVTFLVSVIAIAGTAQGYGPFARATVNESLLLLQTFTGVVAVTFLVLAAVVAERKQAEEETRKVNAELERRVLQRTAELSAVNKELEAFSYSVSHDLRAPLRRVDGFSASLLEEYPDKLEEKGRDYLHRIRVSCRQMMQLIDDLLGLSHVTSGKMRHEAVNLSTMAQAIAVELQRSQPERKAEFVIAKGVMANGDERLLRVVMDNLLGNAWKFTGTREHARIEFEVVQKDGRQVYCVRDDGAGFDMAYADKLFGAFQRLHEPSEFSGNGIGLATVRRIIHRHGGEVWAEGIVGKGAAVFFTLPT